MNRIMNVSIRINRVIVAGLFLSALSVSAQTTSVWTQTAGGAQSWTTGANWLGGSAPSPTALDTVDFSTVDISADTTVALEATRTAANWVFGDTAGGDAYIFNNSGDTFSGLITILSGELQFPSIAAWGGAGKNVSAEGNARLTCDADGYSGGQLSVSNGADLLVKATRNIGFSSLVGSGKVSYGDGNKNKVLTLGDASGFTGTLMAYGTYNGAMTLQFTSIADVPGAGNLQFGGPGSSDNNQNGKFRVYGDAGPVTFDHRRIEILEPTNQNAFRFNYLQNDNANPANKWVINTPMTNRVTAKDVELWLQGSNAGDNEFAGAISDEASGRKTKIFKGGSGRWILSGVNTHTGGTTVNGGTLVLSGEQAIPDDERLNILGSAFVEVDTKERIQILQFNGTNAVDGVWGATGYGAPNQTDRLLGNGRLYVNVPFPPKGTVIILH